MSNLQELHHEDSYDVRTEDILSAITFRDNKSEKDCTLILTSKEELIPEDFKDGDYCTEAIVVTLIIEGSEKYNEIAYGEFGETPEYFEYEEVAINLLNHHTAYIDLIAEMYY